MAQEEIGVGALIQNPEHSGRLTDPPEGDKFFS